MLPKRYGYSFENKRICSGKSEFIQKIILGGLKGYMAISPQYSHPQSNMSSILYFFSTTSVSSSQVCHLFFISFPLLVFYSLFLSHYFCMFQSSVSSILYFFLTTSSSSSHLSLFFISLSLLPQVLVNSCKLISHAILVVSGVSLVIVKASTK